MLEAIWMPNNKRKCHKVSFYLTFTDFPRLGWGFGCDFDYKLNKFQAVVNNLSITFWRLSVDFPGNCLSFVFEGSRYEGWINKLLSPAQAQAQAGGAGINLTLSLRSPADNGAYALSRYSQCIELGGSLGVCHNPSVIAHKYANDMADVRVFSLHLLISQLFSSVLHVWDVSFGRLWRWFKFLKRSGQAALWKLWSICNNIIQHEIWHGIPLQNLLEFIYF